MGYKFNPFTGNLDLTDAAAAGSAAAGSDTEIQYNDGGSLGASADLTWDDTGKELGVGGDVTLTGRFISSLNGAASEPPGAFTGTWFTGGTATTTKPQVLIEPAGTTSTTWSTSGTGLGVNAASGFSGNLLDLQVDGSSKLEVDTTGTINGAIGFGSTYLEFLYAGTVRGIAGVDDGAAMFKLPDSGFFGWAPSATVSATADIELRRDSAGVVKITSGSTGTGYVKQTPVAVSALPAAATVGAGTRGFVNDATATTFASTVTGGGANTVPVYSDGSNWLIG
jgi:hypothetical protein